MMYEIPKEDVDLVLPYILERVVVQARKNWLWLRDAIESAKPGDKINVRFDFTIEIKSRAYDDNGKVVADFIIVHPDNYENR